MRTSYGSERPVRGHAVFGMHGADCRGVGVGTLVAHDAHAHYRQYHRGASIWPITPRGDVCRPRHSTIATFRSEVEKEGISSVWRYDVPSGTNFNAATEEVIMATATAADPRDALWNASFESYYDSYYEELVADDLINQWQKLDTVTKIIVALTASSSAVSGWALWTEPHARYFWLIISGISAVLAVVHSTLGVPDHMKDHADDKRRFLSLRIELETFRQRMKLDPNFDLAQFTKEWVQHKSRYSEDAQLIKSDVLRTKRLQEKAQSELNTKLADEIQPS